MADLTGKILKGRYRVEEYIDRGGMAEVYRVTDLQRGITLAMKVLRADLAEDKVFLNRFQKEARNLAELQHPNIVRFYSLEQEGRLVFILLDFIEGSTLRAILADDDHPMKYDRILQILEPVCKALHYAHLEKRVHCDVKPSNIMVDNKNNVYLADFGIMRHMDTSTMTMEGIGTPAYMAPELIRNEKPTPQTDIYSLGIVLYEMLTGGKRPFIGEKATISGTTGEKVRWEQLRVQPPPPSKYNKKISSELDQFVLKCLRKDPQESPPSW
jgi:serine/threonine protein kinase